MKEGSFCILSPCSMDLHEFLTLSREELRRWWLSSKSPLRPARLCELTRFDLRTMHRAAAAAMRLACSHDGCARIAALAQDYADGKQVTVEQVRQAQELQSRCLSLEENQKWDCFRVYTFADGLVRTLAVDDARGWARTHRLDGAYENVQRVLIRQYPRGRETEEAALISRLADVFRGVVSWKVMQAHLENNGWFDVFA